MVFFLSLTFTAFDNLPIENVLLVQYGFIFPVSGIKKRQDLSFYDSLPPKVTSVPRFRVLDLVFLAHIQKRETWLVTSVLPVRFSAFW